MGSALGTMAKQCCSERIRRQELVKAVKFGEGTVRSQHEECGDSIAHNSLIVLYLRVIIVEEATASTLNAGCLIFNYKNEQS